MSKPSSKRLSAFKTLALIVAIGVGFVMQSHPVRADITAEMPALLTGQE